MLTREIEKGHCSTSLTRDCFRDYSLLKSSFQLFLCVEGQPCLQEWPSPAGSGYHVLVEPVRDRCQPLGMLGELGLFSGCSSGAASHCPKAVGSTHRQMCCTWLRLWQEPTQIPTVRDRRGQPLGHSRLLAAGWAGPQFSCLSLQLCIAPVNRAWRDKPPTPLSSCFSFSL